MDADLRRLSLAELVAKAGQIADRCRACAAAGDDAGDAAAFEQLLPVLEQIASLEEAIDLPQVNIAVLPSTAEPPGPDPELEAFRRLLLGDN